mgnify:CR=1 FL=1
MTTVCKYLYNRKVKRLLNHTNATLIRTYTFIKEEGIWYIDMPDYIHQGGSKEHLQMREGANEVLRIIARGKSIVHLMIDPVPFEGADRLQLDSLSPAPKGGGYYIMETCRGKRFDKRIWLCDITLFIFGDMPPFLYVTKAAL